MRSWLRDNVPVIAVLPGKIVAALQAELRFKRRTAVLLPVVHFSDIEVEPLFLGAQYFGEKEQVPGIKKY